MNIELSPEEIKMFRRVNARIQGHFGGLAKSRNKKKSLRANVRKGVKARAKAA